MSGIKELLSGRPVAYYPALARAVGGIAPALFFQQIAHWQGKNPDAWVYRTQEELEEELAMSPKAQAAARRHLVERGLLEEKRDGMPRRLYYRPVWEKVELALQTCHLAGTDLPDGQVQSFPSGDTTLKSSDESKEDAPKGADGDPSATEEEFQGWQIEEYLRDELAGADVPLTRSKARRYTGEANKLHAEGVSPLELYEAADRVVSEWGRVRLSLDDALRDLRNGRQANGARNFSETKTASAGGGEGTPPEVIEYVFANTRNDSIRNREPDIRRALSRHDFTSGTSPPFPVLAELGGTENERWTVLDSLRALCRRAVREVA